MTPSSPTIATALPRATEGDGDGVAVPCAPDVRLIVDDIDSIIWEVELRSMRFTMVSKQAERILGYPVERWIADARFWEEHIHPEDRQVAVDYCAEETRRCRGHELEYRMIDATGGVVWLRDIVTVIVDAGQPVRLRGVMVDITRQKQTELERDHLLQQTREALRQREDFLAVAAHELRTPLNVLRLLIESLSRSLQLGQVLLPAGPRQKVERADVQVKRLARLVSTMLDVSSLPVDKLPLCIEEFDLRDAVEEAIAALDSEITAAVVAPRLAVGPKAIGRWDRMRVEQLTVNLLSNAIKYGQGNPIEVRVVPDDAAVALVVTDHGIGIAAEDQGRIFERFERAVSLRSYGGLGLGLYIARTIVHAHGGSMELSSEPGVGSTFVANLPWEAPGEWAQPAAS